MPGGAHENMRGWSPEEDALLLRLIETSGKRWKLIAEALGDSNGGRTPAMVRNRYLRIERGRWLTERGMSKNRCGQCGQLKRGHVCQAPRAVVSNSLSAQAARHDEQRLSSSILGAATSAVANSGSLNYDTASAGSAPISPARDYPESGRINLGGAQPLTLVSFPGDAGEVGLSCLGTPLSNLGTPSVPGTAYGAAPPPLRTQDSMEILVMASEMQAQQSAMPSVGGQGGSSGAFDKIAFDSLSTPAQILHGGISPSPWAVAELAPQGCGATIKLEEDRGTSLRGEGSLVEA